MEFRLPTLFLLCAVFSVVSRGSHADETLSPEMYWKQVLPNTPVPKAILDSLNPEWTDNKGTSVTIGKGGVGVLTGKPGGSATHVGVGKGGVGVQTHKPGGAGTHVSVGKGGVGVQTHKPGGAGTHVSVGKGGVGVQTHKPGGAGTHVSVGKGGVGVQTGKGHGGGTHVGVSPHTGVGVSTGGKPGGKPGTRVGVGKGGVTVTTGRKRKPVHVDVHPGPNPFNYVYAATETQVNDDPNVALFFLRKDLKSGRKMTLHFPRSGGGAAFLPRHVAADIPFSSENFPAALERFSVSPGSEDAAAMKQTVHDCEQNDVVEGEEKRCATSLESMVDFAVSELGSRRVKAVSTDAAADDGQRKEFRVAAVRKVSAGGGGGGVVACHKERYPYAVFYCHKSRSTAAYTVALAAEGAAVEAVAVCHEDTSAWNPRHVAFQALKVKPGSVPICHFLPEDHVVWVKKN